jgi:hypothetical protein
VEVLPLGMDSLKSLAINALYNRFASHHFSATHYQSIDLLVLSLVDPILFIL